MSPGLKKPAGGLWTSTFQGLPWGSDWVQWCIGNRFGGPTPAWVLVPSKRARVFVVDTVIDLMVLLHEYRGPIDPVFAGEDSTSRLFRDVIDFEKLALDYDGLHLTERGQHATHLPLEGPDLYGWDAESTVWFRWVFDRVVSVGYRSWKGRGWD